MTLDDIQQAAIEQRAITSSLAHVEAALAPFRANLLAELLAAQSATLTSTLTTTTDRIAHLEDTITPLLAHLDSSLAATQRDLSLARHDAAQSMVTKVMTDPRFQDALIALLAERQAERQAATTPHEKAPSHG